MTRIIYPISATARAEERSCCVDENNCKDCGVSTRIKGEYCSVEECYKDYAKEIMEKR